MEGNKKITDLVKVELNDEYNNITRSFSVFFNPDKKYEDFDLGMNFKIISVNRLTGEIVFSND